MSDIITNYKITDRPPSPDDYERNKLLTNEEIINEMCGSTGITNQSFKAEVELSNPAHVSSAIKRIEDCLEYNPIWQSHIPKHIKALCKGYKNEVINISIHNPSAGLTTLFLAVATGNNGPLYIPTYSIILDTHNLKRLYYGALSPSGAAPSFKEVLDKFYDGRLENYLFTLMPGGFDDRDVDILETLGLEYNSFRCDIIEEERSCYALRNERWVPCELYNHIDEFYQYLMKYNSFTEEILEEIGSRWQNGTVTF